jgi:type VI secretion system protein ImpK
MRLFRRSKAIKLNPANNVNNSHVDISTHNVKNQLIANIMPVLSLIVSIRSSNFYHEVEKLRDDVIKLINNFESLCRQSGYQERTILAARYCVCTSFDETVLNTNWGASSPWVQQSLLAIEHNETWGGERFYIILQKMMTEGTSNLDFLELMYFLLSLGFEGKYYNDLAKRDKIRDEVYSFISTYKLKDQTTLYGSLHGPNKKSKRYNIPVWILVAIVINVLFVVSTVFQYKLGVTVNRIVSQLTYFKHMLHEHTENYTGNFYSVSIDGDKELLK